MSYDTDGYSDTCCPKCGDPNGTPCTSCGYLLRDKDRAPLQPITPWPEYAPLTKAEKRNIDDDTRAGFERDEMRRHYR